MIKLKLYPPSGTIEDAKALKFEVSGVEIDSIRIRMENATHGMYAPVSSLQDMGDGVYMGIANIRMPAHLQQASISIFAHIEEKQEDGSYKTVQICPTIFTVKNEADNSLEKLSVSPSFIGPEDLCSIRVKGEPNTVKVVSVNDKFFKTVINNTGLGSISFQGSDVIGDTPLDTVYHLPIYVYDDTDNFTRKTISDSYLSVLPASIAMHASGDDEDPRCDPDSDDYVAPGTWTFPEACIDDPEPPVIYPPWPWQPPNDLPTICREGGVDINYNSTCRIFSHSATLLNNGMVMHAYLSPDKTVTDSDDDTFNINKVFLSPHTTTLLTPVIASRDVVVEPKEPSDTFTIHVQEDLWMALEGVSDTSANDVYVVLFNTAIGFQRIKIIDRDIDEYTGSYILIGDLEDGYIRLRDWLFCVNAVFYHSQESSSLNISPVINPLDLPYIYDSNGDIIQVVNISIASNMEYVGLNEETYIYVIAEAIESGKSHLYFNSFVIGKDNTVERETFSWVKLTSIGNNQYPSIKMGSDNNIHIVWESDRSGLKQSYYGVIGVSAASAACPAFSACIDKYSEFLSKGEVPFDYLSDRLIVPIGKDIYNPSYQVAEYDSQDLVTSDWADYGYGGTITQSSGDSYINDVTITANALTEDSMVFNSLKIVENTENPSTYVDFPYSQFNYQIEFDLEATVSQNSSLASSYEGTIIDDKEMDNIFDEWLSEFTLVTNTNVTNQPVYSRGGNTFVIGRTDGIFDRIVPIIGSYRHGDLNPSVERFQIDITKQSNNLKDFTFGLMFEKTRFTATNVYTADEFNAINPSTVIHDADETHVIYTGMAKLVAFIKTEDIESGRANYIIVREFPEKIDVSSAKTYTIISNYTKADSSEITTLLDTYNQTYNDKFIGQVTLLIDGVARFSQSFISTISHEYNYFDIGIGIPYGGYYVADKMSPSKLGIFDNVEATMIFTDISISSPTYTYNSNIIDMPRTIRNMTKLRVQDVNPSVTVAEDLLSIGIDSSGAAEVLSTVNVYISEVLQADFSKQYDASEADTVSFEYWTGHVKDALTITDEIGNVLYATGQVSYLSSNPLRFDLDVTEVDAITISVVRSTASSGYSVTAVFKVDGPIMAQIPLTFEGINQSPYIDLGKCNDAHVVWQSNRDKNWNIFYSNAVDKLSPFRFNTKITDTESNSLKPSVSVNRNGSRLILWHDDRNGNYDIFAARSTTGYSCDQDRCKTSMAKAFDENITECSIIMDYEATAGIYSVSLEFYTDAALTGLYKTIEVNSDNRDRWFIDNTAATISYTSEGIIQGIVFPIDGGVVVSYIPGKDDGIFDKVLYVKLVSTVVTG